MDLSDDVLETLLHRAQTGQYINGVAHDLNNLTGASMAYAELIEMDATNPEVKRMIAEIVNASMKSAELLNAITSIARPFVLGEDAQCAVCDVYDAIRLVYAYEFKLRHTELAFSIGEDIGRLPMEAHLAQRILLRLIDNAIEAVRDADTRKVTVSAESDGDDLRIVVSDSGPGVQDGSQDSLFEPGFTTKEGHAGLGLTFARSLAERVRANVEHDGGSRFAFIAPKAK